MQYIYSELFDGMQITEHRCSLIVAKSLPITFHFSVERCHSDRYEETYSKQRYDGCIDAYAEQW